MAKVGIRELKSKLKYYLSLVKNGEQVVVTNRGDEIAFIVSPENTESYSKLAQMVTEGIARWEGGKPTVPEPLKVDGKPISEIVIEDRR